MDVTIGAIELQFYFLIFFFLLLFFISIFFSRRKRERGKTDDSFLYSVEIDEMVWSATAVRFAPFQVYFARLSGEGWPITVTFYWKNLFDFRHPSCMHSPSFGCSFSTAFFRSHPDSRRFVLSFLLSFCPFQLSTFAGYSVPLARGSSRRKARPVVAEGLGESPGLRRIPVCVLQ